MVRGGAVVAPLPREVPVVVLVDGETASAAEILAGALKDHDRARLVGQNTFGKFCSQTLLKLRAVKSGTVVGGIQITVARFFSPSGESYNGQGITPHIIAERHVDPDGQDDNQLAYAKQEAVQLLNMNR